MTPEQLRWAAEALLRIKAAVVILSDPNRVEGAATHLESDVYDVQAGYVQKFARFCIQHPMDKPWLPNAWLWLAARCWKMGGAEARELVDDPRDGLPETASKIVMDDINPVKKGEWSPAQANVIRKALRGEVPPSLWNMSQGWRAEFAKIDHTKTAGNVLIEDPESGAVRESEQLTEEERADVPLESTGTVILAPGEKPPTPKKPKKKLRFKVRKPKARKKK